MKAFIFAAGMGTRLHPITERIPKALVPIGNKTLLDLTIEKLDAHGFDDITINTHHFRAQIREHIARFHPTKTIHLSEEADELLDTGGGLLHAYQYLQGDEPVLIHNVDIVTDVDIPKLYQEHIRHKALATLSVSHRYSSRQLLADQEYSLCGWENNTTKEQILVHPNKYRAEEVDTALQAYSFNGIHIIEPRLLDLITEKGSFPIIPLYLRLAEHYPIRLVLDDAEVTDAGTHENLSYIRNKTQ